MAKVVGAAALPVTRPVLVQGQHLSLPLLHQWGGLLQHIGEWNCSSPGLQLLRAG